MLLTIDNNSPITYFKNRLSLVLLYKNFITICIQSKLFRQIISVNRRFLVTFVAIPAHDYGHANVFRHDVHHDFYSRYLNDKDIKGSRILLFCKQRYFFTYFSPTYHIKKTISLLAKESQ